MSFIVAQDEITISVMKLYWDYNYQPWTNNEQIMEEMLAIQNKENKDNEIDDMLVYHYQGGRRDFELDQTDYRHQTIKEISNKP